MNAKSIFVFVVFCLFNIVGYSQSESYMFNHYKSMGEKNLVYFNIENLNNDKEEQDRVLELLLSDNLIIDGNIYSVDQKSATCQLEVDYNVTVDYIRSILQSAGYDIDLTSVTPKNPSKPAGIYNAERYSFFSGFDGFKDYDPNKQGSLSATDHYAKEKDKWVKENSAAYEEAKKQNGTSIVVRRKDFESFTAEKRQHMLSHPEMFIIEE